MSAESNVELARQGFEAVLRGDLDTIADLLAPDVKWHGGDPSAVGACRNRVEALEFMRRAVRRRSNAQLVELIDAGDQVVVILQPEPAGDGPAARVANLTTFRDGKVVEMVHYANPDDAMAAAGVKRP